jgi:hypothetical protein
VLVLTTPTPLGDKVLRLLMRIGLVSRQEIDEHQHAMNAQAIQHMLTQAGFDEETLVMGRFEFAMNRWVRCGIKKGLPM